MNPITVGGGALFCYAVVTCEIKLFQHYFRLRRCPDRNNFG